VQFRQISGLFYRIVTEDRQPFALHPAISPEGRFHHDAQPTLYVSSRPDWAEHAIKVYVRPDDPPRRICEIALGATSVLDLRDADQCALWGIDPALAAVPWLPERAAGRPATSWQISDIAREKGAQGLIYTARTEPSRWHLVLFDWIGGTVRARLTGRSWPYMFAAADRRQAPPKPLDTDAPLADKREARR